MRSSTPSQKQPSTSLAPAPKASAWLAQLVRIFSPDKKRAQGHPDRARAALIVGFAALALLLSVPYGLVFIFGYHSPAPGAAILLGGLAMATTPLHYRHSGSSALAGHVFCAVLVSLSAVLVYLRGGFSAPALMYALPVPLVALYLSSMRAALGWTAASLLVFVAGYLRARLGLLPLAGYAVSRETLWGLDLSGIVAVQPLLLVLAVSYDASRRAEERRREAAER